jgi:hypothetical protein
LEVHLPQIGHDRVRERVVVGGRLVATGDVVVGHGRALVDSGRERCIVQ